MRVGVPGPRRVLRLRALCRGDVRGLPGGCAWRPRVLCWGDSTGDTRAGASCWGCAYGWDPGLRRVLRLCAPHRSDVRGLPGGCAWRPRVLCWGDSTGDTRAGASCWGEACRSEFPGGHVLRLRAPYWGDACGWDLRAGVSCWGYTHVGRVSPDPDTFCDCARHTGATPLGATVPGWARFADLPGFANRPSGSGRDARLCEVCGGATTGRSISLARKPQVESAVLRRKRIRVPAEPVQT